MTGEPFPTTEVPAHLALVARSRDSAQVDRWALALLATGVAHQQWTFDDGSTGLVVRAQDARRALQDLHAVEDEELARAVEAASARPPEKLPGWALWWTQLVALALLGVSSIAGGRGAPTRWMEAGRMDAVEVLSGAWHRLFTGVTLHADGGHLVGNLAFLLVVGPTVAHRFGPGVMLMALLLTGAAGNAVTAGYHGAHFGNVGASGGLFGLLCMLALLAARTRTNRLGGNRWVLGVGAGLALLSMLGFGEESDVVAHVAGFAAAVPLGLWMPLKPHRPVPAWWWALQAAATAVAAAVIVGAWWLALRG